MQVLKMPQLAYRFAFIGKVNSQVDPCLLPDRHAEKKLVVKMSFSVWRKLRMASAFDRCAFLW